MRFRAQQILRLGFTTVNNQQVMLGIVIGHLLAQIERREASRAECESKRFASC